MNTNEKDIREKLKQLKLFNNLSQDKQEMIKAFAQMIKTFDGEFVKEIADNTYKELEQLLDTFSLMREIRQAIKNDKQFENLIQDYLKNELNVLGIGIEKPPKKRKNLLSSPECPGFINSPRSGKLINILASLPLTSFKTERIELVKNGLITHETKKTYNKKPFNLAVKDMNLQLTNTAEEILIGNTVKIRMFLDYVTDLAYSQKTIAPFVNVSEYMEAFKVVKKTGLKTELQNMIITLQNIKMDGTVTGNVWDKKKRMPVEIKFEGSSIISRESFMIKIGKREYIKPAFTEAYYQIFIKDSHTIQRDIKIYGISPRFAIAYVCVNIMIENFFMNAGSKRESYITVRTLKKDNLQGAIQDIKEFFDPSKVRFDNIKRNLINNMQAINDALEYEMVDIERLEKEIKKINIENLDSLKIYYCYKIPEARKEQAIKNRNLREKRKKNSNLCE